MHPKSNPSTISHNKKRKKNNWLVDRTHINLKFITDANKNRKINFRF